MLIIEKFIMKITRRSIKYTILVSFVLTIISLMVTSMSTGIVNAETRINPSVDISDNCYESNGNIYIYDIDISTFYIELIRSYNSHNSEIHGPFGKGWTHNYNIKLVENSDNSVTIFYEDGLIYNYTNIGIDIYFLSSDDNYFLKSDYFISSEDIPWMLMKNLDDSFNLSFEDGSKYLFDLNGTLIRIMDKNGYGVTFTYADEKVREITEDVSGISFTLNYNSQNKIINITDSFDRKIFYEYDNFGYLTNVSNSISSIIYEYDSEGNLIVKIDPNGDVNRYGYDYKGNLIVKIDPNEDVTLYQYNSIGNLIVKTDPNGDETQYVYDSEGNLIRKFNPSDQDVTISADFFVEPKTGEVINQLELNLNYLIQHNLYNINQEANSDIPENIQLKYVFEGDTITDNISLSNNSHNRNIKIDLKRINDFPLEHYTANIFISTDNETPANSHILLNSTNKTIILDAWGQPRIINVACEGNKIKITMERANKKVSIWLCAIGFIIISAYIFSFLYIYKYKKTPFNSDMFAVFNSFSFLFFVALVVAGVKDYILDSLWATLFFIYVVFCFACIIYVRFESRKENSRLKQEEKMYNNSEKIDELIANLKQTDKAMNELNEMLKGKLKQEDETKKN